MFVSHPRTRPTRRGAILIVVLAMLALFAVLGLSFVLYADSQAGAARNNKIAENKDSPPDPTRGFELAVGQIIYGTDDTTSAIIGHGMADSKFGRNPLLPIGSQLYPPFSGTGIANEALTIPGVSSGPVNRTRVVSHKYWPDAFGGPGTGFIVDSQLQTGGAVRANPTAAFPATSAFVSKAVGHTYPDRSNFYLAMLDPTTGQVVTKSFHRDDLFLNSAYATPAEQIAKSLNPDNPNWGRSGSPDPNLGRLFLARPRPEDHRYNPTTRTRLPAGTADSATSRTDFPYPPANADGTVTGDVSNLKFITGSQKNDSVWLYTGAPVLEWRGRKYTTLVAPLILDLNGRVNLSVAGNVRPGNTTPGPTQIPGHPKHSSNHGWGPWEVNPMAVFANEPDPGRMRYELLTLMQQRFPTSTFPLPPPPPWAPDPAPGTYGTTPQVDQYYGAREGRLTHRLPPTAVSPMQSELPKRYSLVDADGVSTTPVGTQDAVGLSVAERAAVPFSPFPAFPARYPNTQAAFRGAFASLDLHPSMFNPAMWQRGIPTTTGNRPFGLDDEMRVYPRYTDPKARYTGSVAAAAAPINYGGAAPGNPLLAARTRAMTTLYGFTQQWGEVQVVATNNGGAARTTRLGPIDVNRLLPEYRKNPLLPHSALNMWNPAVLAEQPFFVEARKARQVLARDIFVRLAALVPGLIDGVNVFYEPETGYLVGAYNATPPAGGTVGRHGSIAPTYTGFNVLRQLAQYAANMTDYVDTDDVMTPFVWNPDRSSVANFPELSVFAAGGAVSFDPSWLPAGTPVDANLAPTAPDVVGNHTVFGTELPRLVINEAYAAVYNNRADPLPPPPVARAGSSVRKQFWIELHNPLSADPVLSDFGGARLRYVPTTQVPDPDTTAARNPTSNPTVTVPCGLTFNPYRIEVASNTAAAPYAYSTALTANPANVTGDPAPGGTLITGLEAIRLRIDNYDYAAGVAPGLNMAVTDPNVVLPANGAAAGPVAQNQGYYVLGPQDDTAASKGTFPDTAMVPTVKLPDPVGPAPQNALAYDIGGQTDPAIAADIAKPSTVLLRRLANPHLPPSNANPYITVDYVENLPTRDRVGFNNTGAHTPVAANQNGKTIGRRHPYTTGPSLVLGTGVDGAGAPVAEAWRLQTSLPAPAVATNPTHSFFRANDGVDASVTRTILAPDGTPTPTAFGLEWLVHLDRHLVNGLELQHVSAQSPTLLTTRFSDSVPNTAGVSVPNYHLHTRYWEANAASPPPFNVGAQPLLRHNNTTTAGTGPFAPQFANLYKAFDLVQAGSHMVNVPIGGREPGRVNVNTMNAPQLLQAVIDPNEGNRFFNDPNLLFNPAGGDRRVIPTWNRIVNPGGVVPSARTQNGTTPQATTDEIVTGVTPGNDRPFKSFWGSTTFDDSVFRLTLPPSAGLGGVSIFQGTASPHPYYQSEALSKMWNSTTTVSDSFLVVMTVGFFEVMNDGPYSEVNQPVLGKELFDRVPGDLRAQFAAVVDRSNITRDPAVYALTSGIGRPQRQLKLLRDAYAGAGQIVVEAQPGPAAGQFTIYDNGQAITLTPGVAPGGTPIPLRLGYGDAATNAGDGETVAAVAAAPVTRIDPYTGLTYPLPGHVLLTLAAPIARDHGTGTRVGNSVVGHPGPQPAFTIGNPGYQLFSGVLPYYVRIGP